MRIAIVTSGYFPVLDGVTVAVHERLKRLSAAGHETLLLAPLAPDWARDAIEPPAHTEIVGLSSRQWGSVEGDRNPTRIAAAEIDAALERFRPDLIHIEEPERLFFGLWRIPALAFARSRRIPIVAFYHTNFIDYAEDTWPRVPRFVLRPLQGIAWRSMTKLYNRFDATLLPSPIAQRRLYAYGLQNGIFGLFNGADTSTFGPSLRRNDYWAKEWDLPAGDRSLVLLILGRLTADKNWHFWRLALPVLAARLGRQLTVVVAGEGEMRASIESWFNATVPFGRLLGKVSREQVPDVIANSDIYATASTRENASLAVLEALASGTPVVAPEAGGIPGQVWHGGNGLLFDPGDIHAFVDAVASLAADGKFMETLHQTTIKMRDSIGWDQAFEAWIGTLEAVRNRLPKPVWR